MKAMMKNSKNVAESDQDVHLVKLQKKIKIGFILYGFLLILIDFLLGKLRHFDFGPFEILVLPFATLAFWSSMPIQALLRLIGEEIICPFLHKHEVLRDYYINTYDNVSSYYFEPGWCITAINLGAPQNIIESSLFLIFGWLISLPLFYFLGFLIGNSLKGKYKKTLIFAVCLGYALLVLLSLLFFIASMGG